MSAIRAGASEAKDEPSPVPTIPAVTAYSRAVQDWGTRIISGMKKLLSGADGIPGRLTHSGTSGPRNLS